MLLSFLAALAVSLQFLAFGLLADLLPVARARSLPSVMVRGALLLALLAAALNLVVPLDAVVTRGVAGLGLLGLFARRRRLRELLGPRRSWGFIVFALLLFVAALSAAVRGSEYDTGLYHLQTLLWQATSATPPGLANLHHRLAYNSVWHLMSGLVDWGPSPFVLAFAVNAALLAVVLAGLLEAAQSPLPATRTVALLSLAWLSLPGVHLLSFEAGSPATDAPAMLLVFFAIVRGVECGERQGTSGPDAPLLDTAAAGLFATLVKLSVAPVLLVPLALAWGARRRATEVLGLPPAWLLAGTGLALGPWLLRALLLSGCPFFPLPVACLPSLPWAVPPGTAEGETRVIRDWARMPLDPGTHAEGWAWLEEWGRAQAHHPVMLALLWVSLLGVLLLVVGLLRRSLNASVAPLAWPLRAALLGCGVWFFGAPDPRFGLGCLGAAAVLLLSLGVLAAAGDGPLPRLRRAAQALVVAFFAWHLLDTGPRALEVNRPWPVVWRPQDLQRVALEEGTSVLVSPPGQDQCGDAPPPCTPYLDPHLRRRLWFGRAGYALPH